MSARSRTGVNLIVVNLNKLATVKLHEQHMDLAKDAAKPFFFTALTATVRA